METKYIELDINDIELDLDNPRIKQYLEIYQGEITSEAIALALTNPGNGDSSTSYNTLKESIKVSGGIIHPIIVNKAHDGRLIVIEGNTRLQIYKEFLISNPSGPWNKICAIVYDRLSDPEKHSIRLQSHLVGPRDWDPYSKAKYLHQLSEIERLPMSNIISMCGGNSSEINKLISAYRDMQLYYAKAIQDNGDDFDIRQFSKFVELQRSTITFALTSKGFTKNDFAKWVVDDNIDTAQNVRQLPVILKEPEALKVFLKKNVTEAVKKLAITENTHNELNNISYDILGAKFLEALNRLEYKEVKKLGSDPDFDKKKTMLLNINDSLQEILKDIQSED
jgi:hypothetical protein